MKPEASAAAQRSDFDEFIDNLDETLLPDLAREIEKTSAVDATFRLVLHQDSSGRIQSDLRKSVPDFYSGYAMRLLSTRSLLNPSSSPYWKRTWIIYSSSGMWEPPSVGRPLFSTNTRTRMMTLKPSRVVI
jgi:hypothetical protein